jgi:hypothetical protein
MIGIFLETNGSWWDTTEPECFRAKVAACDKGNCSFYPKGGLLNATLSKCSMYPLRGHVKKHGHSEHQALYLVFSLPAILSLLHQGAQCMAPYMSQKQQRRQQDTPGLPPTAPTALLERFGFIGAFYASYLIWTNHASAMLTNPCWDTLSKHVMALNMLWHVLLSNVNLFSAGIAATALLNTSRLDSALAIGIVLIWQGLTFVLIANAMYAGDNWSKGGWSHRGPPLGRWLPNPKVRIKDNVVCKTVADSCSFSPGDLDIASMKGHAVALVCMLMLLAGVVGTVLSLAGWVLGDFWPNVKDFCCPRGMCCGICRKKMVKRKKARYEIVDHADAAAAAGC